MHEITHICWNLCRLFNQDCWFTALLGVPAHQSYWPNQYNNRVLPMKTCLQLYSPLIKVSKTEKYEVSMVEKCKVRRGNRKYIIRSLITYFNSFFTHHLKLSSLPEGTIILGQTHRWHLRVLSLYKLLCRAWPILEKVAAVWLIIKFTFNISCYW